MDLSENLQEVRVEDLFGKFAGAETEIPLSSPASPFETEAPLALNGGASAPIPVDLAVLKAAKEKKLEALEFLLENNMFRDLRTQDEDKYTLLHYLVNLYAEATKRIVQLVLERPDLATAINLQDKEGNTPFLLAAKKEATELCDLFREKGADPLIPNKENEVVEMVDDETEATGVASLAIPTETPRDAETAVKRKVAFLTRLLEEEPEMGEALTIKEPFPHTEVPIRVQPETSIPQMSDEELSRTLDQTESFLKEMFANEGAWSSDALQQGGGKARRIGKRRINLYQGKKK